jgi:hypothetical protein
MVTHSRNYAGSAKWPYTGLQRQRKLVPRSGTCSPRISSRKCSMCVSFAARRVANIRLICLRKVQCCVTIAGCEVGFSSCEPDRACEQTTEFWTSKGNDRADICCTAVASLTAKWRGFQCSPASGSVWLPSLKRSFPTITANRFVRFSLANCTTRAFCRSLISLRSSAGETPCRNQQNVRERFVHDWLS